MFDRPIPRPIQRPPGSVAADSVAVRGLSAPWGPLPTAQFAAWPMSADADTPHPPAPDDPSAEPTPFEAGFAEGWAAAEAQLADAYAAQHHAQQNLADALLGFAVVPPAEVAAMLKAQLIALLETLIGSATVDAALLAARCTDLAALVAPDDPVTLHLHPDDLPLVADLPTPVRTIADSSVTRGSVRLVDGAGSVEAGPAVMLGRLRAHWGAQDAASGAC